MQRLNGFTLLGATLLGVVLITAVNGDIRFNIPPLFRENPNLRVNALDDINNDVNYRLPNHTEPVHYDVELTTEVDKGIKAFTGKVRIDLIVIEPTREIVVHARKLNGFTATIKSRDNAGATEQEMDVKEDKNLEFLRLTPKNQQLNLAKDSNWTLTINYKGELRTDNGGFYLSSYLDKNNAPRYLATTQFESTDARHGFPCYDEPAKRANFTITINHSPQYKAISNMPVDTTKSRDGVTVFKTTPRMPTYLIAFIVSDFEWSEGVLNELPQRVFSRPGTKEDQEFALVSGMLITQRLAEYYGIDFALPKLDQVAVPDFAAGAMENWGLATYREEYLLYNKKTSTVNTQTSVANIIAHEYCHQWFGNLVAIKWWTYLWLKEGFATLFSYQATDDAYPEWGVYQQFHTSDYQRALSSDAYNNSRPMTHYVQKPSEISRLYDSISYSKAGSVLHMWQNALTDKVFRRGLHNYLNVNKYGSAEEWQLFDAIQNAAKEENYQLKETVRNMMSSWTHQGGYPLLIVDRNYNDGSFSVKQEAYFDNETIKRNSTWYVPFNYAIQSNSDFRDTEATHYLLNEPTITIDTKVPANDWLLLNKQSTGYYRINYDLKNWNLIIDGLIEKPYKIHPRNRAQLMFDAYHFTSSKRLVHSVLLQMLTYLTNEDQYAPWSTANSIITSYNRFLSGDAQYANFKFFIGELVNNIYEKLGVNDIPGEQHYQKFTRSIAINLACLAGIESCLKETNDKLKKFIENGIEIEPNLQSQTFCNGLKQSGDDVFDSVYQLLMNSEDQAQRRVLISSLGCAQKESQIKKFIESSIDNSNKLRTQERPTLLSAAYTSSEVGLLGSIAFLDEHWEAYAALTPGFGGVNPLESDILGMSTRVVNRDQEKKLNNLVDRVKNSDKVSEGIEVRVQSNMNANFDWLSSNRDPLMQWVNRYRTGGSSTLSASVLTIVTISTVFILRLF